MILHNDKNKKMRVTLPNHNKDLKPGTLDSILKQAEVEKKGLLYIDL